MFLRIVIDAHNPDSSRPAGLFAALSELEEQRAFSAEELRLFREVVDWFNRHLPTPDRFSRSMRVGARNDALSWFKPAAVEHIARMREIAALLEAHGVRVRTVRTKTPGYVVYEDEYQVVAVPFRREHRAGD